jgi:hypothetical protein
MVHDEDRPPRWPKFLAIATIIVMAIAVAMPYLSRTLGVFPALQEDLAARKSYLDEQVRIGKIDETEERNLAEIYWTRYPDVAGNPYFGRGGLFGVFGAREHYERAGREESREWGANR